VGVTAFVTVMERGEFSAAYSGVEVRDWAAVGVVWARAKADNKTRDTRHPSTVNHRAFIALLLFPSIAVGV